MTLEAAPPAEPFLLHPKRALNYARFLFQRRVAGFTIGETPAFEPECLRFFMARLRAAGSYLEFGSGGSTIVAAKLGVPFVAVESDAVFLDAVRDKVRAAGAFNPVQQTYIHADIGLTQDWGKPVLRRPSRARLQRWRNYPQSPWDAFGVMRAPHLILVDGRFRVACALLAAKFLIGREGEIWFDDYANRAHYHAVERFLEPQRRVGRMAVFSVAANADPAALERAAESYCRDWR